MTDQPEKIPLQLDNCDAATAHAQWLLEKGYSRRGKWSLGQACSHVADWMRYPVDGFPVAPFPARMMMLVIKYTVGPGMKRRILADGFKPGIPTSPESVASESEMSDAKGVEKLRETCTRVQAHNGPLLPSPFFGPMDKDTLLKLTLLHAEHHFGYLEPAENA